MDITPALIGGTIALLTTLITVFVSFIVYKSQNWGKIV